MPLHFAQTCWLQSTQYFVAAGIAVFFPPFSSMQKSQSSCPSTAGFAAFCASTRSLTQKFSGNAEIPASGTSHLCLQTGQSNSSPGNLSLQWLLKHSRQNVWRQGSDFGSVKSSKQIEHLVRSSTWAWRSNTAAMTEPSDLKTSHITTLR